MLKTSRLFLFIAIFFAKLNSESVSANPVVIEKIEASVNSHLILQSDVSQFKKTLSLRTQLDPLFSGTSLASEGTRAKNEEIVEFLINEKLIVLQFPISDAEVEQEINSIQTNNKIDRSSLKSAIKDQGFDFNEYFELIRISASKRNLIDRDIRTKVSISEDDIKNFFFNQYAKNTNSGSLEYYLKIISVSPSNYKSVLAAKEVIDNGLKSIRAGESFEDVAKRISDDSSAMNGGDLGLLTDDQISPAIKAQLTKIKIGETSEVFGSGQTRYLLIKLVDVKSNEDARLNKMKEEIRNHLVTAEYQHQISLWIERQKQTAFIHRAGEPAIKGLPAGRVIIK